MTEDELIAVVIAVILCVPAALFFAARICLRGALNCVIDEGDLG